MFAHIRINWLRLGAGAIIALSARGAAADGGWQAGVASVSITPPHLMWMSGYGSRDKPAEGKLTELWAKALVIEDAEGRRAALVTLDLVGIDRELSLDVKSQIAKSVGISPSAVELCCSHTHTGPVVNNNLRAMYLLALDDTQWALVSDYAALLRTRIPQVVAAAVADLRPAEILWGQGAAGFAVNRRNNQEGEVPARRAAGTLRGPVDHDVPVLAVRKSNSLAAVVFGYACHATVLSFYEWSGDYPGFAQSELEARHPGCLALFCAGCGGDQNPLPRREVELAKSYGSQLATAVDDVLAAPMKPVVGLLQTTAAEVSLPFAALPTRESLDELAEHDSGYEGRRARLLREQWDAHGGLEPVYPYPVQAWRLGDGPIWLFLGGEVVVDYSLRLKRELGPAPIWVTAYANDVMAYIPSRRVLQEGGYEGGGAMVYYGLPSPWDESVEQRIIDEANTQAQFLRPASSARAKR